MLNFDTRDQAYLSRKTVTGSTKSDEKYWGYLGSVLEAETWDMLSQ